MYAKDPRAIGTSRVAASWNLRLISGPSHGDSQPSAPSPRPRLEKNRQETEWCFQRKSWRTANCSIDFSGEESKPLFSSCGVEAEQRNRRSVIADSCTMPSKRSNHILHIIFLSCTITYSVEQETDNVWYLLSFWWEMTSNGSVNSVSHRPIDIKVVLISG